MKYLEELKPGDLFSIKNDKFIITSDYKEYKDKQILRQVISLSNGFISWMENSTIVDGLELYYRDKENNIIALKEFKNEYSEKGQNFS